MENIYLQQFAETLKKHFPVSDNIITKVFENFTITRISKNDLIAGEGKSDPYEYILLSGILNFYSVSSENEEITTRIFMPQSVITPHIVRTSAGKSIQALACLQDAVVAKIPVEVFSSFMNEFADLRSFGHNVVHYELVLKTNREVSLLTLTAKERLLRFRKEYPNLENLIPHTIIAGFLGVTPVSFSRLRNEIAKSES